jgi:hypothetical protein
MTDLVEAAKRSFAPARPMVDDAGGPRTCAYKQEVHGHTKRVGDSEISVSACTFPPVFEKIFEISATAEGRSDTNTAREYSEPVWVTVRPAAPGRRSVSG